MFSQISRLAKLTIGFALVLTLVLGLTKTAWSQLKIVAGEETRDEFQVATGIGITLTGPSYFVNYQLVDQNGFRYDVMNILSPDVRKEINLTDDQLQQMVDIKIANEQELGKLISNAVLKEDKSEVEALFRQAQDEMRAIMEPEQLERFEQVKNRLAIKQVGLAKHLALLKSGSSIPDNDLDGLNSFVEQVRKLRSERALELLKAANRQLVDQLEEEQRQALRSAIDSENETEFAEVVLGTPMFSKQYSSKRKFAVRKTDLFRILKLKKVRTRIELSEDQYAEIKELDRTRLDELQTKLDESQKKKLNETVAQSDLKRMGTVNAICCGHLREVIGLDEANAQALHQTGQKLNEKLEKDLQEMDQVVIHEAMSSLSKTTQDLIKSAIGENTSSPKLDPFSVDSPRSSP